MEEIPNLQDAFVGAEIVLHLSKDEALDVAKLRKALEKHKVKMKGEPKKNAEYVL